MAAWTVLRVHPWRGRPIHRADWSYIWRPAVEAAGLPAGFGLRDLRHYFATVLIFGGAHVKTVQLAMGTPRRRSG